jgi:two-component system, OmpR family, phosphate regulon response regulator PhoB
MASCGFPANFFGDIGECRPPWFYTVAPANHYDDQGEGREYSPDRWGDEPKLGCTGPVPASLLLLSATGAPRPALLRALDPDEELRVSPGALRQSAATVDDADVVVIDATDSAAAGIDALVNVRRQSGVPVVFVAGEGSGPQAVQALELGADDFVIEPFVHGEVAARIRSVLRRCRRPGRSAPFTFGRLSVFPAEREVRVDGHLVETTPLEFDLLARLVAAPRRVFSRTELLEEVWGSSGAWQSPATVTEHIRRLRLKLEADRDRPRWLHTVRGVGYRFDP